MRALFLTFLVLLGLPVLAQDVESASIQGVKPDACYTERATDLCPRHFRYSAPQVERDDPAYLRWRRLWIEREANLLKRDDLRRAGRLSEKEEDVLLYAPEGWSPEPMPESLLADSSGEISLKRNFLTYFLYPVGFGLLVVVFFRARRPVLSAVGFVVLLLYISHVADQVGLVGFFVWILGFLLLCSVLKFAAWLFLGL
ncbi:MAG: hypothetical protein M5U26_11775 [Planctomycetota bacterium]|nr:hypothetical protein [Planctomycetota bacterium]